MASYALDTLLGLRIDSERQAERALGAAAAAHRRALDEGRRLEARAAEARAALAAARQTGSGSQPESAADAQARLRFWSRLEAAAHAARAAVAAHQVSTIEPASQAEAAARAAHLRARQRREVVEKAIARRRAAHQDNVPIFGQLLRNVSPQTRAAMNNATLGGSLVALAVMLVIGGLIIRKRVKPE